MVIDRPGHRRWLLVALCAALLNVFVAVPAQAAPGDDDEGASGALRAQLDAANRSFLDAQAALDISRQNQAGLANQLADIERRLGELSQSANDIAVVAYRSTPLRTASTLLDSASPDTFIDRVTAINTLAARNDKQLREHNRLRKEVTDSKRALDAEVAKQEQHLAAMAQAKAAAEKAVGPKTTDKSSGSAPAAASAAPRRANGSLAPERCSADDPTTSGCLTPRTLHALQQARAAGFTRFTSCFRSGGGGEHPKGRACDFAAQASGFGPAATGGDKVYGDNLNVYFQSNAGQLGVMYVIWYRKIWQVATGDTRAYSGCCDPAAQHTNHVHLSMY
jgi:peptidoglycan DL-endopeptidase CwlO